MLYLTHTIIISRHFQYNTMTIWIIYQIYTSTKLFMIYFYTRLHSIIWYIFLMNPKATGYDLSTSVKCSCLNSIYCYGVIFLISSTISVICGMHSIINSLSVIVSYPPYQFFMPVRTYMQLCIMGCVQVSVCGLFLFGLLFSNAP